MIVLAACTDATDAERQREQSVKARTETFARAESVVPLPQPQNFPLRAALVEFTDRQDMVNHPWYIYVLGQNGNAIGYFVGKTYPQNVCNFLSSTERVETRYEGTIVLQAPSLDGVYYGGSGASGACTSYFFFDAATNAMQVIDGLPFFVSDAPLALDAKPIRVSQ